MSVLSLLLRVAVWCAVFVCVLSAGSSSSSSVPALATSISASVFNGSTAASAATSSPYVSSTGSAPSGPVPFITGLIGCNSTQVNGSTPTAASCDGTASAVITILGGNFTSSPTVKVVCSSGGVYSYSASSASSTQVVANTPSIDKSDVDKSCSLMVVNPDGQSSNGWMITFGSYGSDIGEAFRLLGLGLSAVVAILVVMVIVLIVFTLCMLSCCCGVSLACLNVCCPRRSQPTIVLSPQSSGYSSMA